MRHCHRGAGVSGPEVFRLFEWREVWGFVGRLLVTGVMIALLAAACYWLWSNFAAPAGPPKPPPAAPAPAGS